MTEQPDGPQINLDGPSLVCEGVPMTNAADTTMDVAETIAAQLGGMGRLAAMLGAKHFNGTADALSFKFAAKATNGANHIEIKLMPDDTYDITWRNLRGLTVTNKGEAFGLQVGDLRRYFTRTTGLYLSL